MEEVPSAGPGSQRPKEESEAADSSDDESSSGPDMKEVKRFILPVGLEPTTYGL